MKIHIEKAQRLLGFISETAPAGATIAKITVNACGTSDDPQFHDVTEQLWKVIVHDCPAVKVSSDTLFNFVYIIHQDESADLYLNQQVEISCRPKRDMVAGEEIYSKDIADINGLRFSEIAIEKTDRIFCCFKVDWKFGWYYNFPPDNKELDSKEMSETCGSIYRYLRYEYLFSALENELFFSTLVKDGWFPFLCILDEFKQLIKIYKSDTDIPSQTDRVMDGIDSRIDSIIANWWNVQAFLDKKQQIEAGIAAYRQTTNHGYIQCINTLYPLVEGIMRAECKHTGIDANKRLPQFIDLLIEKCKRRSDSNSLLLPDDFLKFLKEEFNKPFDANADNYDTNRNTVTHGASNDYSRKRALQSILMLDQIHFYLL